MRDLIRQFNDNRQRLCGYFRNRGLSPEDSEDLTQEVFVRAWKAWPGFRGEASIKTWLYQIARSTFRQEIRRRRAGKRDAQESPLHGLSEPMPDASGSAGGTFRQVLAAVEEDQPLSRLLNEEKVRLVREALAALPPKMRNCMVLYTHQERKYREIAVLTRLSINTVKSHIFQARQLLKQRLGDHFDCFGR